MNIYQKCQYHNVMEMALKHKALINNLSVSSISTWKAACYNLWTYISSLLYMTFLHLPFKQSEENDCKKNKPTKKYEIKKTKTSCSLECQYFFWVGRIFWTGRERANKQFSIFGLIIHIAYQTSICDITGLSKLESQTSSASSEQLGLSLHCWTVFRQICLKLPWNS